MSAAPKITGRGLELPPDVLSNDDVAALADPRRLAAWVGANRWCQELRDGTGATDDDAALDRQLFARYVEERIGIRQRRVMDRGALLRGTPGGEPRFASDLGAAAALRALDDAGVDAADLDLVLCGTSTPDRVYPTTAIEMQERIGARRAYGFDLLAACTSFVYGLEMIRGLILAGLARRALLVAAEYFSCGVDYADPSSSFFWGDAAAAVVVEAADLAAGKAGYEVLDCLCFSRLSQNIRTGLGGTRPFVAHNDNRAAADPGDPDYRFFYQDGPAVYREVVPLAVRLTRDVVDRNRLSLTDVRLFLFHQASTLVIEGITRRLFAGGAPAADAVPLNLDRYGNTSSCGAPLCLVEETVLGPGELACMTVFGAGYTAASALLRRTGATAPRP